MKKIIFALLMFLLAVTACTPQQTNSQTKEFTIRAFQFGFEPSTIEVNKGDTVKITAYTSDVPHSINIPDFGVNLRLDSPEKQTTEFVADKAGTFMFFCGIPCGSGHRDMTGTLIVH